MATAAFNYFYRVDVTLVKYAGVLASTTTTFSFVNKFLKDSASATTYWPILKSVGEVAVSAGELLPNISLSSVEIDNRIGTFGANRKFSDILSRWSPIERSIVFYIAQVANDSDAVTSWTQVGQGVITGWEATSADDDYTLRFDVRAAKYAETVLNLEVARSISGMENAPTSSLGRPVPLLIGNGLEVVPVRISADYATTAKYAWGTCYYQLLENDSAGYSIYTKNYADEWEPITGVGYENSGATPSGQYTLNTYASRAFKMNINGSSICTGVQLRAKANGLASSSAYLSVFILRVNYLTNSVVDEVARARVSLANYDSLNSNVANTNFPINVSFDRPVVIAVSQSSFYHYYLGFEVTGYQVNDLALHYGGFPLGEVRKDAADATAGSANSYSDWKYISGGTFPPLYKLQELTYTFTDHVSTFTQSGLTYSSLTVAQFTPDSGQSNPTLDNLPLLLGGMTGLTAYGTSTVINRPPALADLLSYSWSGTAWGTADAWDTSTLQTSHYETLYEGATPNYRSRTCKAVFESRVTYSQFLAEICRGTASRVGVVSTGKSFMYPFGVTATPAFDIPAADVAGLSWEQRGVETVINRALIKLGRSYLYAPRSFESNETVGFRYITDFSSTNFFQVQAMAQESRVLYGNRDLAQTEFLVSPDNTSSGTAGYMGDSTSQGSILAEYYIGRFGRPLTYCSFVVPFHRYSAVKMFDIVTFTSVQFPAYYGVDANARDGTVDTGSSVTYVTTADGGNETVRAETYRGLVEGVSLVLAMEQAPAIRLTVLVLLNQPFDPT